MKTAIILAFTGILGLQACSQVEDAPMDTSQLNFTPMDSSEKVIKDEAAWQQELSEEEFRVLRQKGTEMRGGEYDKFYEKGTYACAGCGAVLFTSDTKYDSGSGWPAFYDVANTNSVRSERDTSILMDRVEVLCNRCDGHLGHVFEDGPQPTGLRYCINSVSLDFIPGEEE